MENILSKQNLRSVILFQTNISWNIRLKQNDAPKISVTFKTDQVSIFKI